MSPADFRAARFRRVSRSSRTTWSARPSLSFSASRRSRAWMSVKAVSASTPHRQDPPVIVRVPRAPIAGDVERDLRAPRQRRVTPRSEAIQEGGVRGIADRISGRIRPDRQVQTEDGTDPTGRPDGQVRAGAPLDAPVLGPSRCRRARATSAWARPAAELGRLWRPLTRRADGVREPVSSPTSTARDLVPIQERCSGSLTGDSCAYRATHLRADSGIADGAGYRAGTSPGSGPIATG